MTPEHVSQAIGDPNFFTMMPEFLPIKNKMNAANVNLSSGCPRCKRRMIAQSMTADFASILISLSPDGIQRLKKYFGFQRMIVRAKNHQTGRVEIKEV